MRAQLKIIRIKVYMLLKLCAIILLGILCNEVLTLVTLWIALLMFAITSKDVMKDPQSVHPYVILEACNSSSCYIVTNFINS